MLSLFKMLLTVGILHSVLAICAAAQTPSGLPNTPPSAQLPQGSAAGSGGHTVAGTGAAGGAGSSRGAAQQTSGTTPAATSNAPAANTSPAATNSKSANTDKSAADQPAAKESNSSETEEGQPNSNDANNAPSTPTTTILPGAKAGEKDPTDVGELLAPGPLPKEKLSLIGATVKKIDPVREKMTVKIHGADSMKIAFDQRTHFYRDGREVTQTAIKPGDRVYVDTQIDQNQHIFAKNVRVQTSSSPADATGQILSYDRKSGEMIVQDNLSSRPVRFRTGSSTEVLTPGASKPQALDAVQLKPGSLVTVKFSPAREGGVLAEQVRILAETGSSFTFYGKITHVDLKNGRVAIENESDGKTYEIAFDGEKNLISDDVVVGARATIIAKFQGSDYEAESITLHPNQQVKSEADKQQSSEVEIKKPATWRVCYSGGMSPSSFDSEGFRREEQQRPPKAIRYARFGSPASQSVYLLNK